VSEIVLDLFVYRPWIPKIEIDHADTAFLRINCIN